MKVAIVSESPADEAAIAILVDALTARHNVVVSSRRLRPGGWTGIALPSEVAAELKSVYFGTDAHALVTVLDSDDSTIHEDTHEGPGQLVADCRICRIQQQTRLTLATLSKRPVPYPLQIVLGLAVPALEAWLLYNKEPKDSHITESRFEREREDGKSLKPVRRQLKIRLYGMTDPPLITERAIMMREANRLATDLKALEMAFPKGFGRFAQQVRAC